MVFCPQTTVAHTINGVELSCVSAWDHGGVILSTGLVTVRGQPPFHQHYRTAPDRVKENAAWAAAVALYKRWAKEFEGVVNEDRALAVRQALAPARRTLEESLGPLLVFRSSGRLLLAFPRFEVPSVASSPLREPRPLVYDAEELLTDPGRQAPAMAMQIAEDMLDRGLVVPAPLCFSMSQEMQDRNDKLLAEQVFAFVQDSSTLPLVAG